ncbi:MAG: hypothetical protein ABIV43_00180 [Candidatus Saccharimonadales bacterium]
MENSPFNSTSRGSTEGSPSSRETDDEKKDKKDSKKGKALGSLMFERPKEAEKSADKASIPRLFEKPAAEDDTEQTREAADRRTEHEAGAELTADDSQYAAEQIARARQAELAAEPPTDDVEQQAETAAAQDFYDKIADGGLDPESAAAETLVEFGSPTGTGSESLPGRVDGSENAQDPEDDNNSSPITASTSGGSAAPPPSPPTGPPVSGSTPPNPNLPPNIPNTAATINNSPTVQANPNSAPVYYNRSRPAGDLLIGGIVGYLIGRRRGRIKTERKLLPVQKKLERQVRTLASTIERQEVMIRQTARQRVQNEQRQELQILRQPTVNETIIIDRRERPLPAPELHNKPNLSPPPERIGRVLVAAEAARASARSRERAPVDATIAQAERQVSTQAERQVETLSRNELLTLSEKVIVEGSTLRQVYETNLISERGLRRLITEYLRGGDVVRAFKRELVERQIDFERDPQLRDTVRKNLTGGGRGQTLTSLLTQAGVAPVDDLPAQLAAARAQDLKAAKSQAKLAKQRKAVDISLATVIAVLMALVIFLALSRM